MFNSLKNCSLKVINTDPNSFCLSGADGKIGLNSTCKDEDVNILAGGSTALGVGVTSDKFTISSQLSKLTFYNWLNLSARAHVTTYEFIRFAFYRDDLSSIKKIIIFSGVNDFFYIL